MKFLVITLLVCCSLVYGDNEERPSYKVISTVGSNVEIRQYDSSKWACTNSTATMFQDSTMFWRLFGYIQGANDKSQKIAMTAPVLMWHQDSTKSSRKLKVMCFYVPKEFQSQTPNPTSKDVFLNSVDSRTVATIRFGGFASSNDYLNNRNQLVSALGSDAKNYDSDMYLMAGYDSPFKFVGRTNEVWIKKLN